MKHFRKISAIFSAGLAGLSIFALGAFTSAQGVPPSIEGGNIYQVRNLTKGGDFTDPARADKCEELQYRVRLHNPGPDEPARNVTVQVVFPTSASTQNVSTATVRASNTQPSSTTDTATVNLSASLKVNYVAGSSQLFDINGNFIKNLSDVTAGAGANIGDVGVSVNERRIVQFKAKVDCPQQQQVKKFECKALNVTQASRTRYNFTAVAAVENVTVQSYRFTVKNQSGTTIDEKTVTTSALSADYQFDQSTPGEYIVTAVVNTDAGSTNPNDCAKKITVTEEGKPPVPPAPVTPAGSPPASGRGGAAVTPGALPETGPGSIAAIAGAVSVLSATVYYMVTHRFGKL